LFDGDEMNIFVPQSIQTEIELEEIASVSKQIVTPATSKTIIGILQDGLLGSYNLTSPSINIDWRSAQNIISYTSLEDFSEIKKNTKISGSDLISLIIPKEITINRENLQIKNGKLIKGRLSKDMLGVKKRNHIIHNIFDQLGPYATKQFIDNTQRMVNNFNLWNGFSCGIGDTKVPTKVLDQIEQIFQTKKLEIEHFITEMENNPDQMQPALYEFELMSKMDNIRNDSSKLVMENLELTNAFHSMSSAGSKGDHTNIGQMAGALGLNTFEGNLFKKNYNRRTSQYFQKNDDRGPSRGLIRQSFVTGLDFTEFVYHMACSRLGIIEGAVKTAETGYAQRKLVKISEDVKYTYDGTVRNANDIIIQMVYGDTNADTTRQFEYKIKLIEMSNDDVTNKHIFTKSELSKYPDFSEKDNDKLYKTLLFMRDTIRENVRKAVMNYIVLTTNFMLQVNLDRIVNTMKQQSSAKSSEKLTPQYILDEIENLLSNKNTPIVSMSEDHRQNKKSFKYIDDQLHKTTFKIAVYDILSPKRVLEEYGFSKDDFDNVILQIGTDFRKNIVEYGEMVGILAAQSTGENLTQMSLNSFHNSGVASISATVQGVPRMREIVSGTRNPKSPQMRIYLQTDIRNNKEIAYRIGSNIRHTTFGELKNKVEIYYDEYKEDSEIMKKDNIKHIFSKKNLGCQNNISGLPFLLRIELDKEKMLEKEVTLLEIKAKFCNWWGTRFSDPKSLKREEKKLFNKITQLSILSNTDNDPVPIIHIRLNGKDYENDVFDLATIHEFIDVVIDKFKLKGINDVKDIPAIPHEVVVTFDKKTGEVVRENEYVILTKGSNLNEIRYIKGIDFTRTMSNNIMEVYDVFGIEIVRAVMIREITSAYSKAGSQEINYQHIELLVDEMTHTGSIHSIDRHGMNKSDADPLGRASFEKPVDILFASAVWSEVDNMKGVSAKIMAGQVINGGTGYVDLELNVDMIEKSEYIDPMEQQLNKHIELETGVIANDLLDGNDSDIFIPE
jgi:DNA-directed RNA polymerase II subunit RPB1